MNTRARAEFEADEVEPQSEGRDRIGGRVEELRATPEGLVARIMRYSILLPAVGRARGAARRHSAGAGARGRA